MTVPSRTLVTGFFAIAVGATGLSEHALAHWFVVVALAAGLSHGAVDHLLSGRRTLGEGARFYAGYLSLLSLVALLWAMTPAGATWAFFLASAYHFGQSDFLTTEPRPEGTPLQWWTRGLLLVLTPLAAWPAETAELLKHLLNDGGALAHALETSEVPRWSVGLWLLAIHLGAVAGWCTTTERRVRHAGEAVALTLLMTLAPPFVSFSTYFVLWHTASHWRWAAAQLEVSAVGRMTALAAPMTVLASLGLAALWWFFQPSAAELLRWSLVAISALTVPHLIVVDQTTRTSRLRLPLGRVEP